MEETPAFLAESLLAQIPAAKLLARGDVRLTREQVDRALTQGPRIARLVKRFLTKQKPEEEREPPPFDYDATLEAIGSLGDVQALADRLAENIAGLPSDAEVAPFFTAATLKAMEHLRDTIPTRVLTGFAGARNVPPSDLEVFGYRRRFSVIDDPLVVLENMLEGTLTTDEAETLRAVYPEHYERIRGEILLAIMELRGADPDWDISGRKDRMLEILLGQSSMSPDLAAQLRQAWEETRNQTENPTKPGGAGKDTWSTPAQRLGDR